MDISSLSLLSYKAALGSSKVFESSLNCASSFRASSIIKAELDRVSFKRIGGRSPQVLVPIYSFPVLRSSRFVKVANRLCYRCGDKGHIREFCRNSMKCFFCGCWSL